MSIPSSQATPARQTRLLLLAGLTIWFLHQNLVYSLTSLSCRWGWFPFEIAGLSGLQIVQLIVTVIAKLLMLWVIFLLWRNWQEAVIGKASVQEKAENHVHPFMFFVVMGLNGFLIGFVIVSFVPVLTLNPCG